METKRVVPVILLSIVLMILLTPYMQRDVLVMANPIFRPPLAMSLEWINATVCFVDGGLLAKVNATYFLQNFGDKIGRIDYPLPPNAERVTVILDNGSLPSWLGSLVTLGAPQPLEWTYNSKIYSTAIGDWPMINFTVDHTGSYDIPCNFGLEVYYEHFLPLAEGSYTYLYALGSSRYAERWLWPREAFVTVGMQMNYTDLNVYSVGYSNGSWMWNPATYTAAQETMLDTIKFEMYGATLEFTEDFVLTFSNPSLRPPFDLNGDLKVDIKDLAIEARAFGTYAGHPNWELLADINRDGQVDIRDLVLIAKNFGKTYP